MSGMDPVMVPHEARRALAAGQFAPYFQPKVVLRTGKLAGFEVLTRWLHPDHGVISPNVFIPIAEKDGWIGEVTEQILCKALAAASVIPAPLTLAINISPLQLRDSALPERIRTAAEQNRFSPDRIVVEITETALADNLDQARAMARELRALGCRIALDDFGTGYSSLHHLQSLPFDELKVDQSFVSSMAERRENRKIVGAVLGLGQSLGLATVAEGVETREQAEMLFWLGCDLGQGWLFGKPVPVEGLGAVLSEPREGAGVRSPFRWKKMSFGNLEGLPSQRLSQLRAIYDGAPVGLGFLDCGLRYVNLNQKLADMHGLPVEDHLGRSVAEMASDILPQIEPFLQRALQGEAIADVEIKQETNRKTFLASYRPARDEAGEVVGVSCAIVDFTARKEAEERLRQFERVVEGLEEMIVVIDRDYRYVLANRAFLNYRAVEVNKLIGRPVSEFFDGEIFESIVKGHLDDCFGGNTVHYDLRYRYPHLGDRDLQISYAPIWMSGGVVAAACVLRDVTEQKRLERAESGWQKRIELAQKAGLRIGLWDWDVKTNTVVWSDESCRQWGFTPGTFTGRVEDALTRIHPDDRLRVEESVGRVIAGLAEEYAEQYRVVWPDGGICWIDAHGVILRGDGVHMLGIGVDITHLKRIQQSLQESEENYLLLLNSTAEAIYGLDLNGNCTFCNPATLRLLGYHESGELLGRNMHRLCHHTRPGGSPYPEDECVIYRAIREGNPSHVADEVLWRADGTSFPAEYWSYPMSRDGTLVGAVVTFLDITGRKEAEEARTRSEARYRDLFENARYGILLAKEDGTLLDVNPELVRMLGYGSKAELLTRNLYRDITEGANASAAAATESKWKRKDGNLVTVHASGRAIRAEQVSGPLLEVTAEDITERKSLEEQFRQAQKMDAIGQLAGGVAHDFNNLLTVINGYSELLLNTRGPDDPERHLVEQIRDAGWKSAALTRQLLMFSRKQIPTPRVIDLNAVITNVEAMLQRIIGEDIVLRSFLSAEPCTVKADPGSIEQMIMNLAVNARDAMPRGGQLTIRTELTTIDAASSLARASVPPGTWVLLTMSDTGTGMTDEVKNRAFEPFFTTKGAETGTGLGLSVVHGIVMDCAGHIKVETRLGRGTSFRIYLPQAGETESALNASDKKHASALRGSETILLVEDDHALLALLTHILTARGFLVLHAADGPEALTEARKRNGRIDLLATDIVMPGLGGRQLAEQLRSLHPETKVLYLSGYTDDVVARQGIAQEQVQFLEKPFSPDALIRKIRDVLDAEKR